MKQIFGYSLETIRSNKTHELTLLSKAIDKQIMFHPMLSKIVSCLDAYLVLMKEYYKLSNSLDLEMLVNLAYNYTPPGHIYTLDVKTLLEEYKNIPDRLVINCNEHSIDNLLLILHYDNFIAQKKVQVELNLKSYYKTVTQDNINCAYNTLHEISSMISSPHELCMQIAIYIQILTAITPFTCNDSIKIFYLNTLKNFDNCIACLQQLPDDISMNSAFARSNVDPLPKRKKLKPSKLRC